MGNGHLKKGLRQQLEEAHKRITELETCISSFGPNIKEKLQNSEEILQALLRNLFQLVFLIDKSGTLLAVNDRFANQFGCAPSDMLGRCVYDLLPPIVAESRRAFVEEVIRTGQPGRVEDQRQGKWLDNSVYPISDATGRITQVLVCVDDITERKKMEEALRESEERLRGALDAASLNAFTFNPANMSLTFDEQSKRIWGLPVDEEVRYPAVLKRVHPDDFGRLSETVAASMAPGGHGNYECEFRILLPGGSVHWVHVRFQQFGQKPILIGVQRDITERKRAEEKLRKNEAMLARAQQMAHVGHWERDLASQKVLWSAETYRIFGLQPQECEMDRRLFFDNIHPEDREHVQKAIRDTVEGARPYDVIFRVMRPDGTSRWVHSQGEISSDQYGKPERLFGTVMDVTDRTEQRNLAVALSATSDLQTALNLCLDTALRISSMDAGAIYLVDQIRGRVHLAVHRNIPDDFLVHAMDYDNTTPNFYIIQAGRPVYGPWATVGPSHEKFPDWIRSLAIVPIVYEGTPVACLNLGSSILDDIPGPTRTAIETVAAQMGGALTRIQAAEKYRNLFANATEGIFQTTLEGRFLSANPALAHLLGFDSPDDLMEKVTDLGRQLILDPEVRPAYLRMLHDNGILKDFECRMRKADGSLIWGRLNARAIRDETGQLLHFEGTFQEVTQRKLAVEQVIMQRDLALRLANISDFDKGLTLILETALKVSGMESGGIWLKGESTDHFELRCSIGLSENFLQKAHRLEPASPAWSFIMGGKNVYRAADKKETPLAYQEGFKGVAIVPILQKDQVTGSLNILSCHHEEVGEQGRLTLDFLSFESGNIIARMQGRSRLEKEVETRRKAERALQAEQVNLIETNAALRVLLKHREEDRKELEGRLVTNVKRLVLPYVERLRRSNLQDPHAQTVAFIESNLKEILSPFLDNVKYFNLTPRQIEIAVFIKEGRTTKEIAELLHLSQAAIDKQRFLLRKRLSLGSNKNLRAYLLSLG